MKEYKIENPQKLINDLKDFIFLSKDVRQKSIELAHSFAVAAEKIKFMKELLTMK
ncbi:MAG: hypothetical protein WC879_03450 [Melioribacteraceae bacterium]